MIDLMDLTQLDVDKNERPVKYVLNLISTLEMGLGLTSSPPKIKTIRIVENPFDDIVPRITAAEKREQMKAKLEAKVEMEKRDKRSKAKKWVYLSISSPSSPSPNLFCGFLS